MLTSEDAARYKAEAAQRIADAGIYITAAEADAIETADFGLNRFEEIGLGVLVYVNTDRCCAKELAMWPGQTCPEHRHPPVGDDPGKEETFRCRAGRVYLYVEGPAAGSPACAPPSGTEGTYTVWNEVALGPGDQYTIFPNIKHWFQAGPEGCVVSEFSTRSTDENDIFTDEEIQRITQIR